MQHRFSLLASTTLLFAAPVCAQSPLVSPSSRTLLEGSSFSHLPIGRASTRMQTLHSDIPGGTLLTGHAYRRDAAQVRGHVDGFVCDMQVTLSISPNAPTQASTTFANNPGPAPVVVVPRQLVGFPGTDRPALDPAPTFELLVPYQVPFVMPPQGGTLCVDIEIWGNTSTAGTDRNLSLYLDSHEHYTNGHTEQPGFRFGQGCPAPGSTTACSSTMSFWHLGNQTQIDLALRNGVAEDGSGLSRTWIALGTMPANTPWPQNSACTLWGSADIWFPMPSLPDSQGDYDGSLTNLPILPPGYRLWCQSGSIHLGTGAQAFSDGSTLVTPPAGTLPIPTSRVANSNDHAAATGTLSYAVPVMQFF
jgi:hypothetical protein